MDKSAASIGIIGCGYWGRNLARIFRDLEGNDNIWLYDTAPSRAENLSRELSIPNRAVSLDELWQNCQAVVIATPPATHFEVGKAALEAGKHVLLEKPMSHDLDSATKLAELAVNKGLVLFVDNTFLYSSALQELKYHLSLGGLGKPLFFTSFRLAWGRYRTDADAILDLAPHDFSILFYLFPDWKPNFISLRGSWLEPNFDNAALMFFGELPGLIYISRIHQEKVRQFTLAFEKGILTHSEGKLLLRRGTVKPGGQLSNAEVIAEDKSEPLLEMARAFLDQVELATFPSGSISGNIQLNLRIMECLDKARSKEGGHDIVK